MQGVEIADLIMKGIPEETYLDPSRVNSIKASNQNLSCSTFSSQVPDYEFVIAHLNENMNWLANSSGQPLPYQSQGW